ncbi:MAG: hypothetical protein M3406_14435 [Chloroflexota bacterium]|nr:hypothetical protein [Chloroflexota bacterium]
MDRRRCFAALPALLVGGVVACTAATPAPSAVAPTHTPSPSAVQSASPFASASTAASPSASELAVRPSPNRLELEIGQINPDWLWPMLDFASDSYAVIYSSGVLDGPIGDGAPDLWRYIPGQPEPELLWRNPERDRQLAKIAGDTDLWAFSEISSLGERWWNLWLLTEPGGEPLLLDSHPGDEDIPSLVPSFDVDAGRVAWTSFGRGAGETVAVSQLWVAEAPGWDPRLLAEADAAERAFWLPSLYADDVAYVDVAIGADPIEDVRHVMLLDFDTPGAVPVQLDTSGNATMPVLNDDGVVWKEPDAGFAMFNWGRLFRYTFETQKISTVRVGPQEYVNYPSGGGRFVAMWGADSSKFAVHDLARGASRTIARYDNGIDSIMRPHLAGDLLVWLHAQTDGMGQGPPSPLAYAWLPEPGSDRGK